MTLGAQTTGNIAVYGSAKQLVINYKNRHFNQHMIFRYCEEAWASLCKRADSQEPLLPAQEILIFITLSNDFACANVQTHQSIRCWRK